MKRTFSLRLHTWFFVIVVLLILNRGGSLHPHHFLYRDKITHVDDQIHKQTKEGKNAELFWTGSSIPDCSHACGPCFPCRRVTISNKCLMTTESCPVIYRCFCRGKYYHVPSN
ncbi:hypothetical protein CTI12_AA181310 [Artemisia annua]|uniref:Epidermal patterning factor-like protein n=1 Tax=Artemisia annua TaxID=35608 RepID=A0A2U1P8P7_ARTAN|nr:hypothetical protein CTI12_AA181310 [Artemisia annua]